MNIIDFYDESFSATDTYNSFTCEEYSEDTCYCFKKNVEYNKSKIEIIVFYK